MVGIEAVIDDIALLSRRDPLAVRKVNFYGVDDRNITHYGQTIVDNVIHAIVADLEQSADYHARRGEIRAFKPDEPASQARDRADAGEVRHFRSPRRTSIRQAVCFTFTPMARCC